jgi:hypothetical protein
MSSKERLKLDEGDTRQITRQRRGRQMTCPSCASTFESMRRFQLQCPACGHAWVERSNRNILDWLREQPANLAGGLIWLIPVICLLVFVAWIVAALVINTQRQNVWYTLEVAAFVFTALVVFILIGRSRH